MSKIATQADFQGSSVWYTEYRRWPDFGLRADKFAGRYTGQVAVIGCAYGYLVAELVERGIDAYGCDASSWAIEEGLRQQPALAGRLFVADATIRSSLSAFKADCGLSGGRKFGLVLTEDVLSCAETDAEAGLMLAELRRIGQSLAHVVMAVELPGMDRPAIFLWRTPAEWRAIIGAGEPILCLESMTVV